MGGEKRVIYVREEDLFYGFVVFERVMDRVDVVGEVLRFW